MRSFFRSAAVTGGLSALVMATCSGGLVLAQSKTTPPAAAAPAQDAPKQMPLSEKQVQGLLAAQKDLGDATAKLGNQDSDKPNPKLQAQIESIVKKNGFANYEEYDSAVMNVGLVLAGFDPESKTFIGPDAVVKKQIEEVKADKQMPPLDKKKALAELQTSLKQVTPVQYPENIKLVAKYYDKLSEALQGD